MGTNIAPVDVGAGRTAVAGSAGARHSCVVLVKLPSGRLGGGDLQNGEIGPHTLRATRCRTSAAARLSASRLETRADIIESSTTLSMLKDSPHPSWLNRSVIVGCFSPQDDATLKCWGLNIYGQLGLGDTSNRGDDVNGPCPPPRLSCLPHVF